MNLETFLTSRTPSVRVSVVADQRFFLQQRVTNRKLDPVLVVF
jgi:hypothetical protein